MEDCVAVSIDCLQRTLNTTNYSLSPNLSFLLLSYHQSGHQHRYKLIHLNQRSQFSPHHHLDTNHHLSCRPLLSSSLLGGDLIQEVVWVTDTSLVLLTQNKIYYQVISHSVCELFLTINLVVLH